MPKETFHESSRGNHEAPFILSMTWAPDRDVQIGVQVADPDRTVLDVLYGEDSLMLEGIGRRFYEAVDAAAGVEVVRDYPTSVAEQAAMIAAGAKVIEMIKPARGYVERDGLWFNLDRVNANGLVRATRKARDAAYGADA